MTQEPKNGGWSVETMKAINKLLKELDKNRDSSAKWHLVSITDDIIQLANDPRQQRDVRIILSEHME